MRLREEEDFDVTDVWYQLFNSFWINGGLGESVCGIDNHWSYKRTFFTKSHTQEKNKYFGSKFTQSNPVHQTLENNQIESLV